MLGPRIRCWLNFGLALDHHFCRGEGLASREFLVGQIHLVRLLSRKWKVEEMIFSIIICRRAVLGWTDGDFEVVCVRLIASPCGVVDDGILRCGLRATEYEG